MENACDPLQPSTYAHMVLSATSSDENVVSMVSCESKRETIRAWLPYLHNFSFALFSDCGDQYCQPQQKDKWAGRGYLDKLGWHSVRACRNS